jgi:hypothetical protein
MKKQLTFLFLCSLLSSNFCANAGTVDPIIRSDSGIMCKLGNGKFLSFQYATPKKMRFVYNTEREKYNAEPRVQLVDPLIRACQTGSLRELSFSDEVKFSTRILKAIQTNADKREAIIKFATEVKAFLTANPGSSEAELAKQSELGLQMAELMAPPGLSYAQKLEHIVDQSQKTNAAIFRALGANVLSVK